MSAIIWIYPSPLLIIRLLSTYYPLIIKFYPHISYFLQISPHYGGFHSHGGTPIAGWFLSWKIPKWMMIWGFPYDSGKHHLSPNRGTPKSFQEFQAPENPIYQMGYPKELTIPSPVPGFRGQGSPLLGLLPRGCLGHADATTAEDAALQLAWRMLEEAGKISDFHGILG